MHVAIVAVMQQQTYFYYDVGPRPTVQWRTIHPWYNSCIAIPDTFGIASLYMYQKYQYLVSIAVYTWYLLHSIHIALMLRLLTYTRELRKIRRVPVLMCSVTASDFQ